MTQNGSARVRVDFDLCEGNADCELAAPEVFRVGDEDVVEVLDPNPSPDLCAKVEEAVRACPKAALSFDRA